MIKTKYVDMYNKQIKHSGVFYTNGKKYKVEAWNPINIGFFEDEYSMFTYLYEFYKGRYKCIRFEEWTEHKFKVEDAVNYIIDKAYARGEILEEYRYPEQLKIDECAHPPHRPKEPIDEIAKILESTKQSFEKTQYEN